MTWSILARDAEGRLGVAIASRFFAVGALCVHSRRGVGVLATQALMNPLYGPAGLDLLAQGRSAAKVVASLTGADAGRDQRQLHVLPAHGAGAAHTGSACIEGCGQIVGEGFSVAGNMLAGPGVIAATADAYLRAAHLPLAELARLHVVSLERFQPFMACLPGRRDPVGLTDRAQIEARIAAFSRR